MITKLTHTALLVRDQDEALQFFVEKLGFIKADDVPMGPNQRWLTVKCKNQPHVELILQAPDWGTSKLTEKERRACIGRQCGLAFSSDDIQADYKSFKEKGVKTLGKPTKQPWGTQLLFEDLYGNVHILVEPLAGSK